MEENSKSVRIEYLERALDAAKEERKEIELELKTEIAALKADSAALKDALHTLENVVARLQERYTLAQVGQAALAVISSGIALFLAWLISRGGF